jgi:hypothetical protein
VQNFFLNVKNNGIVGPGPLLPGMANVTQQQYEELIISQLTELWTQYGNLTERTSFAAWSSLPWASKEFRALCAGCCGDSGQCGSTAATRQTSYPR